MVICHLRHSPADRAPDRPIWLFSRTGKIAVIPRNRSKTSPDLKKQYQNSPQTLGKLITHKHVTSGDAWHIL
eukprot:81158-Pleurochrysis_carterae.AAC.1